MPGRQMRRTDGHKRDFGPSRRRTNQQPGCRVFLPLSSRASHGLPTDQDQNTGNHGEDRHDQG